jgi:hypothetical protein
MSAKERREHLEQALAAGGTIMTARGAITRQMPSSASLARTPEERRAAREDIERRSRALEEEARLLEGDEGEESGGLSSLNVTVLKEMARERGIEGYGSMRKAELVAALEEAEGEGEGE